MLQSRRQNEVRQTLVGVSRINQDVRAPLAESVENSVEMSYAEDFLYKRRNDGPVAEKYG